MLISDHSRGMAKTYLRYAVEALCIAPHAEQQDFWINEAITDVRTAAKLLGFDLVPRAAEKLEAAE